jgi:hypothetical protein
MDSGLLKFAHLTEMAAPVRGGIERAARFKHVDTELGMKRYSCVEVGGILILMVEKMGLIGGERHPASLSYREIECSSVRHGKAVPLCT